MRQLPERHPSFHLLLLLLTFLSPSFAWSIAPPGYLDASTFGYNPIDATNALQSAINTGANVYVPNLGSSWVVKPIKLVNSNQRIVFESGTVVEAARGAYTGKADSLFYASNNVTNVSLFGYGAVLKMRQDDYTQPPYMSSEFRAGIALGSISNFTIAGLTIKDTGGDGIYVGGSSDSANIGLPATNVTIKDVVIDNAFRNGISIVDAENVTINNAVILSTSGVNPQAGIDLEPDLPTQILRNINIKHSIINGNNSQGILLSLMNMGGTVAPATGSIDRVTIMGNGDAGILMTNVVPGFSMTNSLILNNGGPGIVGVSTGTGLASGSPPNEIKYSDVWGNIGGATSGWVALGSGTQSASPVFASTDPLSPYFMYLDSSTTQVIAHGANNGGPMGARPIYKPGLLARSDDFERFDVGDKLTIAEGWSANVDGTGEPINNELVGTNARHHEIASIAGPDGNPTKALKIQTATYTNMALSWQQKIRDLGSPTQVVFGFDALMQDNVPGVPSRVMVRSANDTFFWAVNDPNDGPPGTVNMYLAPTSNILSPANTVDGTWYRFEVLLDFQLNTVAPRYGIAGMPLGPFGPAFLAGNGQLIDANEPFVLFSSDTVYYDNFSLTIAPTSIPGDYNGDGTVSAADYTVWRDGGSPDDSQAGYDLWKANFGNSSGSSSGSLNDATAVPESGTFLVAGVAALCVGAVNRRSRVAARAKQEKCQHVATPQYC